MGVQKSCYVILKDLVADVQDAKNLIQLSLINTSLCELQIVRNKTRKMLFVHSFLSEPHNQESWNLVSGFLGSISSDLTHGFVNILLVANFTIQEWSKIKHGRHFWTKISRLNLYISIIHPKKLQTNIQCFCFCSSPEKVHGSNFRVSSFEVCSYTDVTGDLKFSKDYNSCWKNIVF